MDQEKRPARLVAAADNMKRGELIQHPAIGAEKQAKAAEELAQTRAKARTIRLRRAFKLWRTFREWSDVSGERGPWCPPGKEGLWCPPCPEHQFIRNSRTCKRCGWEYEHHVPFGMGN